MKDQLRAIKPRGGRVSIKHKYPRRIQRTYQAELIKMVMRLYSDINDMVKPDIQETLRQDSAASVMRAIVQLTNRTLSGDALARRIAESVAASNESNIQSSVARALGVNIILPGSDLSDALDAWVIQNGSLITSMQNDYLQRVQNVVNQGFRTGRTYRDIAKDIREATGITRRRATLIARDQVGSLNAQVTEQRDKDLGITEYIWRNAGDIRVRGNPSGLYPKSKYDHWRREGKKYSYDKPPADGNPGEPIQCRCFAEAVIEF